MFHTVCSHYPYSDAGLFQCSAQVYANEEMDNVIITYSHLLAEERLLLLSDGDGDVTAVDLRTNQQASSVSAQMFC